MMSKRMKIHILSLLFGIALVACGGVSPDGDKSAKLMQVKAANQLAGPPG